MRSPRQPSFLLPRRCAGIIGALVCLAALVAPARVASSEFPDDPAMIRFEGGGWGHGVGMSQYGAYGRAVAGQSHADILGFYYPGSDLTVGEMPESISVHLFSAHGAVLTTAGPVSFQNAGGDSFASLAGATTVTIDRTASGFTITTPDGVNHCIQPDPAAEGQNPPPVDHCAAGPISIPMTEGEPVRTDAVDAVSIGTPGKSYQWGTLVVSERFETTDTLWLVLDDLDMDTYLYGLAEVPASWPAATLEAQAVAGRTYAYERITSRRASDAWDLPWDLYSTVNDQVYYGYANETGPYAAAWQAAVHATTSEVLLHGGSPVAAFYSSSNGGHTEDSGYVFSVSLPYLPAQPDSYDDHGNPYATWTRDYTGTELNTWLSNSSVGSVGAISGIEVQGPLGASGRTNRATVVITGTDRTATTTGVNLMGIINNGVAAEGGGLSRQVLSTKYTIEVLGSEPIGVLDRVTRSAGTVVATGWVFDPDDGGVVPVDLRVDGVSVTDGTADLNRFDVDAAVGEGSRRGYELTATVGAGAHQVCVYAANLGGGPALLLGCEVV